MQIIIHNTLNVLFVIASIAMVLIIAMTLFKDSLPEKLRSKLKKINYITSIIYIIIIFALFASSYFLARM